MRFFICERCGNMVEMIKESGVSVVCCGQNMTECIPGTSDGDKEKHVPVVSVCKNMVCVEVGEKEHPMEDDHYIEWIIIETTNGMHKKCLRPGCKPKAEFFLSKDEKVENVYAYCNKHGLWGHSVNC